MAPLCIFTYYKMRRSHRLHKFHETLTETQQDDFFCIFHTVFSNHLSCHLVLIFTKFLDWCDSSRSNNCPLISHNFLLNSANSDATTVNLHYNHMRSSTAPWASKADLELEKLKLPRRFCDYFRFFHLRHQLATSKTTVNISRKMNCNAKHNS